MYRIFICTNDRMEDLYKFKELRDEIQSFVHTDIATTRYSYKGCVNDDVISIEMIDPTRENVTGNRCDKIYVSLNIRLDQLQDIMIMSPNADIILF